MIPSEFESEADVHDSSISETLSLTSEYDSSFNNGAAETTRKLNKFRSIKLLKLPSVRLKSPNYMKTTTSSTAKKDNFQKLARNLSRRSSFKRLTRLPSTKIRRPLMKKSSGGSDLRKKMSKSRSIKLRNRPSAVSFHDAENAQLQARTFSIRPLRMLKKMSSLRINRSSMKKSSQMLDRNIQRATCSSTLKGSKFPNHLEIQLGGSESLGISTIKVCPYTYCSLHGHSHSTLPPLKRFVFMRRRVLSTQTSVKLERQSSLRAKRSSNVKKGIRGRKMSGYRDAAVPETSNASKVSSSTRKMAGPRIREDNFARDDEGTSCSNSVTEDVLGELSDHLLYTQEDLQQSEIPTAETDSITSSYEEISVNGEVHREVNEEKSSTLDLVDGGGDLESITLEDNGSAGEARRSIDTTISSVSICEQLEEESAACEEKNGDYFPKMDSESDCNTRADNKRKMEEQKHMGLWHLIYKHMASVIAVEDKEEVEDADTSPGTQKSGSSDFFGSIHRLDVDNHNHEQGSHIQLFQQNAIKLVKEAFDTILSEIPDQSPDDQSSDSGSSQNKEFSEKNHDAEETSIPNAFNSRKEGMAPEPKKTSRSTDNTQSEIGSKSKHKTPRNWSYLKKMFVLNRFVKALNKAKKFNPRKPQFLPIPSEPEAEKVHLHHQSLEEKKKSEEWMLDYALQQVISTLAPSQKRKVALLVQAFESVGPGPSSNLDASSQATQDESYIGLSNQKSSRNGEETYFGISLHKTSLLNKKSDENLHHINVSCTEERDTDSFSKLKELNSESSCTSAALSSQITDAGSRKMLGVIDLADNEHNSIVKDDQSDPINCYLVQDAPKLADVANNSNCIFEKGEVSESEVHDLHLDFNGQKDVADTSNDVFSDRQFSVWEVRSLGLGFSDQHDFANTPNGVLANREGYASGVGDLQFREIATAETDNITSSHDEISLTGEVNHKVNEEKSSTLNLADCGCDLELITWEENASAGEVSRSTDNTISSVSICEQLEAESAACEENIGDYSPETDFDSDHSTRVDNKREIEEQKHVGLWRLIYKHMASGITAVDNVQASATETDKEVEDAGTCPRTHESGSSDFSGIDHGLDVDNNHEQGSHIQLYQQNAIKLVKEAFDKILSDIPDQSPDDQSSETGSTRYKEFVEKIHDMEESSILTSFNSRKEVTGQEPQKNMLNTDIANGLEEEKTQSEKGSASKQETPRNWSYLKKMIVLNRFVKALDKAKKFNPRKPRFLPIPSDPEAEKVHLRHQSLEEKKESEEWMFDYALQQVISTLAPSQKRKVALLVQAFESVVPSLSSYLDASSQDVADTSNDVFADREVSASEVHDLDLGLNDQYDVLASGEISESEVQDQRDAVSTSSDVYDSEVHDLGPGFNKQQLPSNYQINRRGEQSDDAQDSSANGDVNSLVSVTERGEKSSKVTKAETVLRNKFLQFVTPQSPHEESKASFSELTHEKQGNMGLWHLIYKHMVSGTTTPLNEAEGMNNTDDHQVAGSQKVNFQEIEAIRMVEQAIDEIPLPDSQDDSPDDHSITSDMISEQEQIKKPPVRVSVSTEADPKVPSLNSGGTGTEEGDNNAFRVGNNTKQQTKKSWSNLKKMILLRKFVAALEKVKNFNPREPRLLPLDSEKEAEKVLLRHQEVEDRKNGDEWMLDYALQQVVTKLTPARKRKVQLLVEAFETVIPT